MALARIVPPRPRAVVPVRPSRWLARREVTLAFACALAAGYFGVASPYFFSPSNLATVLNNGVELMLTSLGLSLVLATAGIDISVGGTLGICAIFIGWGLRAGWPGFALMVLGPWLGTALGFGTGAVVVFGRVPPIVATLGLYGVYRAAIYLLLGGSWLSGLPRTLTPVVTTQVWGVPIVAGYVAVAYLAGFLVLRWTPLGLALLATGGNERAARLAGVATGRAKLFAYTATGALVGFAAVLYVGRYRNVENSTGSTLALDAVVAAILGGTSALGGHANLLGTLLGVLLVRTLQNGFVLVGAPSLWQPVITGGLLLVVLILEAGGRRQRAARGALG